MYPSSMMRHSSIVFLIHLFIFLHNLLPPVVSHPPTSSQLNTLRLSIIQDHFQFARKELLLSLILDQAQPTQLWATCTSLPSAPISRISTSCYIQPETAAHLFMFFSFANTTTQKISDITTKHHPIIQYIHSSTDHSSTETIATNLPTCDFFFRSNNQRGAFTIPTYCHKTPHKQLFITITFLSYKFRYTQLCPTSTSLPSLQIQTSHLHSPAWHASTSDETTALSFLVKNPLDSLHILNVRVDTDQNGITPILDEDPPDFISSNHPWKTLVKYHCDVYGPSSAAITITLDITPYESLTKTWRKTCGAIHPPEGLVISTSPWSGDIALNGRVLAAKPPALKRITKLYVGWFDTKKGEDLRYGDVHITASGVVAELATSTLRVKSGHDTVWTLRARCLRVGTAEVGLLVRFRGGYLLNTTFVRTCGVMDVMQEWLQYASLAVLLLAFFGFVKVNMRCGRIFRLMKRTNTSRARHLKLNHSN